MAMDMRSNSYTSALIHLVHRYCPLSEHTHQLEPLMPQHCPTCHFIIILRHNQAQEAMWAEVEARQGPRHSTHQLPSQSEETSHGRNKSRSRRPTSLLKLLTTFQRSSRGYITSAGSSVGHGEGAKGISLNSGQGSVKPHPCRWSYRRKAQNPPVTA